MIRAEKNPVIVKEDIPDIYPDLVNVTSVFNPGGIKIEDKYILLLRVQNRGRRTFMIKAESNNGIDFIVDNQIIEFDGISKIKEIIYHIYDPRITKIDDTFYLMFAMDLDRGCQLGLAKTIDFEKYEFLDIVTEVDTRNGVLFPEKINGKYLRMERPNRRQVEGGPLTGDSIVISESSDLLKWDYKAKLCSGNPHYWDELIGSGPPPVKTQKGWLHIYHGIAMHYLPIYQVGVMLLDLNDPTKLIARGSQNILEPREYFELVGQVPNVIFPTALIVEKYNEKGFAENNSEVKLYYGAADTSVCMATSTIDDLVKKCFE